jgi:hypothetical protein
LRPAILRAGYGRLGNQLFQYSALASLEPRILLLQGFESLFEAFANVRARRISWPDGRSLKRFDRRVGGSPTLRRLVPTVEQDRDTGSIIVSGRGPLLYCRRATFFQSPEYLDAGLELEFREEVTAVGEEFLERVGLTGRPFIFVHVRGGDYRSWPSKEAPAFVPEEWLIRSAEAVLDRHPGLSCVVVGDDSEERERLGLALGAHVSDLPEASDLWLMSMSTAGVLSASSFSLWGSARAFHRAGAPGPFIAPNYWVNHRIREWGTSNIRRFEHLTFNNVLV